MNNHWMKGCLVAAAVIFAAFVLGLALLIGTGSYLSVGGRVVKVDAIVVLSGDEGERVREAADWYRQGYGNYLVITKTDTEDIGENNTYSQKLMRIAIEEHVPQDAILFTEGSAHNTIEEARAVLNLSKTRNLESILIITDPYHTRRAEMIFDRVFDGSGISTSIHGVRDSWYKHYSWFFHLEGWQQTFLEIAGILYLAQEF